MSSYAVDIFNNTMQLNGISSSGNDTSNWAHWITVSTLLSINITEFPYLLVNCMTGSQNNTIQIGVVVNNKILYPINIISPSWTTNVVDLREYQASGNVTEIFIRSRALNDNTTLNTWINNMLLASEIS